MIARHTGYEPGVFTHFVANEQIYDRHIEAAEEMVRRDLNIERDVYFSGVVKVPKLILNPEKTNFYDMTIDDFTIVDYEPIKPQLRLELGI
jgi:thymidylate synthase